MSSFTKIIAFPRRPSLHLVPSAGLRFGAYPRFAKAFGDRTTTPRQPILSQFIAAETIHEGKPAS